MKRFLAILLFSASAALATTTTFPFLVNQTTPTGTDFVVGYRSSVDSRFQVSALWSNYFKSQADSLYQPLDIDLTSIAGVTGSGSTGLFFRFGPGDWRPITLSGLTLSSAGLLTATGSGSGITALTGDVTASGTGSVAATLVSSGVAPASYGSASQIPVVTFNAKGLATNASTVTLQQTAEVGCVIDGGGSTITTGFSVKRPMAYGGTITGWKLVGNASGSITVDVRKGTPSGGTVTTSTIAGGTPPSLTSQQFNSSSSLGAWTTSFSAGDVLEFVVTGTVTSIQQETLILGITR